MKECTAAGFLEEMSLKRSSRLMLVRRFVRLMVCLRYFLDSFRSSRALSTWSGEDDLSLMSVWRELKAFFWDASEDSTSAGFFTDLIVCLRLISMV